MRHICLGLLLISLLILPVSAETVSYPLVESLSDYSQNSAGPKLPYASAGYLTLDTIHISEIAGITPTHWQITLSDTYYSFPSGDGKTGDCTLKMGTTVVGYGRVGYFKSSPTNWVYWVDIEEWTYTGTGYKLVKIVPSGITLPTDKAAKDWYNLATATLSHGSIRTGIGISDIDWNFVRGAGVSSAILSFTTDWKDTVSIDDNGSIKYISIQRVFPEKAYSSSIAITDSDSISTTNSGTSDYSVSSRGSWININITSTVGNKYTIHYPEGDEAGEDLLFTLSLSSSAAAVGGPVTATLTPAADAPRYSEISWTVTDPNGNSDIELYTKSSPAYTDWTHYNKTSRTFEASTSEAAHTLTFTPTSAGAWTVSAVVRDQQPPSTGAALASVSATCDVTRKAGDVDVIISIFDGARTSSSYLAGVGLTVTDLTRNGTVLYDSSGTYWLGSSGSCNGLATVSAPLGDEIQIHAEKTGYVTQEFTTYVQPTALPLNQMPIALTLMPSATPAEDQVYMSFTITTMTGAYIEGATVQAGAKAALTNSVGSCRLAIPANETVSYVVSADGYYSQSGYILPQLSNSAITIQLVASNAPVTPVDGTPTPATTSAPGSITSHREAMRESMNGLYGNMPTYVGFAFFLLFFVMMKRGMK